VLALPGAIFLATWWRHWLPRLVIIAASVLQLVAIYIGGYRSIWFVVCIQVAAACVLRVKKHGVAVAILVLVVAGGGYQFIPNTHERVVTGLAALQGNPIDHSALDRKERALQAVNEVIESPFGKGWSSAGWVHSDFLQVAVNLGLLAALIFVGGYIYTLVKLVQRLPIVLKTSPEGELGLGLFLSFLAVGSLLAMQGVQVLPQMVLPVWFVWSMVSTWLTQTAELREPVYSYAPTNLYPAANFQ
jgi:O-antigen ligase